MTHGEIELEFYAAVTHVALATGYAYTLPYWVKRKSMGHLLIGLIGAGYHAWSVYNHLQEIRMCHRSAPQPDDDSNALFI